MQEGQPLTPDEKITALVGQWRQLQRTYPELQNWRLVPNKQFSRALGKCKGDKREIHIGTWIIHELPVEQIIDTLRHEAAHALAGVAHGHDAVWREWARRIGATPERCAKGVRSPASRQPPKWAAVCPNHGTIAYRKRRTHDAVCSSCHADLSWEPYDAAVA